MKKLTCCLLLAALLLAGCSGEKTAQTPASLPQDLRLQAVEDGWYLMRGETVCGELTAYPLPKDSGLSADSHSLALLETFLRGLDFLPEDLESFMLEGSETAKGPTHLYLGRMEDGDLVGEDFYLIVTDDTLYILRQIGEVTVEDEEVLREGLLGGS